MSEYPNVANPELVGEYPASAGAGGGYFFDEVLEYRVWCHPERGAPDPVFLPMPPNGAKGWVDARQVSLAADPYRIRVELGARRLTVTNVDEVVVDTPVGVGQSGYDTPTGTYYLKELLQPPDPNGAYGPYAYGISGFSTPDAAEAMGIDGPGIIGIHGTNQPDLLGSDVSHGCIRVANDVITEMAGYLPLGTPVEIVA